jgi:hypothetical protein
MINRKERLPSGLRYVPDISLLLVKLTSVATSPRPIGREAGGFPQPSL